MQFTCTQVKWFFLNSIQVFFFGSSYYFLHPAIQKKPGGFLCLCQDLTHKWLRHIFQIIQMSLSVPLILSAENKCDYQLAVFSPVCYLWQRFDKPHATWDAIALPGEMKTWEGKSYSFLLQVPLCICVPFKKGKVMAGQQGEEAHGSWWSLHCPTFRSHPLQNN